MLSFSSGIKLLQSIELQSADQRFSTNVRITVRLASEFCEQVNDRHVDSPTQGQHALHLCGRKVANDGNILPRFKRGSFHFAQIITPISAYFA